MSKFKKSFNFESVGDAIFPFHMDRDAAIHLRECYSEIDRLKSELAAKGACPECGDGYTETCPVCQLDDHPVGIRLYDKIAALRKALEEIQHYNNDGSKENYSLKLDVIIADALEARPTNKDECLMCRGHHYVDLGAPQVIGQKPPFGIVLCPSCGGNS